MPAQFNVGAARSTFMLAPHVREKIVALMLDLDETATGVIERAILQLWQREMGEPGRDALAEIDEIKRHIGLV